MKILSIDTSCDETACAITQDTKVISNIIWSQASAHAKFGGVFPSLAQRMHEERIDFVISKAVKESKVKVESLDAIAVTIGPGLSIALGVGVNKAKELATKYNKPLIPVNHVEAHLLSPLAVGNSVQRTAYTKNPITFPTFGLVVSGGNTLFVLIKNIGDYEILAQTVDDALGEALDKAARMLGLGYPGGAVLETMARLHKVSTGQARFVLPIPLVGQEKRQIFSYSGLKTAFYKLIESHKLKDKNFPSKQNIYDLSAAFQDVAFKHITRIVEFVICPRSDAVYLKNSMTPGREISHLLVGGGVVVNIELRKRLRSLGAKFGVNLHIPYTKKLCTDNAAMIGVCAYLKNKNLNTKELSKKYGNFEKVDRDPRLKL